MQLKVKRALGFVLKNFEDGTCRYLYAHESNTILERSKLVCSPNDMFDLKENMEKMDFVDDCTKKGANTKLRLYKLATVTDFASLLKDIPMGCEDTVLPQPFLKNHNVNCIIFEKNTRKPYNDNFCLFRAVALHLHGIDLSQEET